MKYKPLNDQELFTQTKNAALKEKEATLVLLECLAEVDKRRLYASKAYSSLFEYVVKELGYSESQAAERVNAVRLMSRVPEVKEHLEKGKLTLTSASQIQRFIRLEERANYHALKSAEKIEIINECLNQPKREVEKILFARASEEGKTLHKESIKTVSADRSEVKFMVSEETLKKIEDLKNLTGEISLEKLFEQAVNEQLLREQKKRGIQQVPGENPVLEDSASKKQNNPHSRYIPKEFKSALYSRARGQCEFTDSKSKRRCTSTYRLQIDHIYPFALGGKTELSNLRLLCATHNQWSAQKYFAGKVFSYRRL